MKKAKGHLRGIGTKLIHLCKREQTAHGTVLQNLQISEGFDKAKELMKSFKKLSFYCQLTTDVPVRGAKCSVVQAPKCYHKTVPSPSE